MHAIDPVTSLRLASSMGARLKRVVVVGCEPSAFDADEGTGLAGLSEPVRLALDEAVCLVESLIARVPTLEPA
jgi:hydrogenase maturation protease